MKCLVLAASLRKDSLNKKLARVAAELLKKKGLEVEVAEFSEFDVPLYNYDIEVAQKVPPGATLFASRMQASQALVLSSPEYNFSMPGTIKNLIDWVSRIKPVPWKGQKIFLMSASPSAVGGNRGLWSLRVPLETCGSLVYPEMFSLAKAHEAFSEAGQLNDKGSAERLEKHLTEFLDFVGRLSKT